MNRVQFRKNRQKTKLLTLFIALCLFSIQGCAQKNENKAEKTSKEEDYLKNVDYSIQTDIINPDTLTGDYKKIFYHKYFLGLTHKQTKNLSPLAIKNKFAEIGITPNQRDRYVEAVSFFITYYRGHKKSCENYAYFDFLKPKSEN